MDGLHSEASVAHSGTPYTYIYIYILPRVLNNTKYCLLLK